ncbi:hypothetical protein HMSSN036_19030 [Paenibacillus macerans]|nr:hypothetical protein HMSSN036_19030 [Paenibacillus macerans]
MPQAAVIVNTRKKRKLGIVVIVLLLAGLCGFLCAGRCLVITPNPAASQAIVVLSGETGRLAKGLELYRRYGADFLIVSNADDRDMAEEMARLLLPEGRVLEEVRAKSTLENAAYVKEIMKEKDIRSAIVVTSNYHSRRTKYLFDQVFRGEGIRLSYDYYVSGQFRPDGWWSTKLSFMITADEYVKLLGNSLGLGGRGAKRILRKINNMFFEQSL